MRDDKNPPIDDRVFAIPNIVPAKTTTESNCFSLILSKQYLGTKYIHIDIYNFMHIYLIVSIQMCSNNLLSVTFYKQNSN